jgi:tRNA (cytidine/uridine-2'-O-)-methyltransferase
MPEVVLVDPQIPQNTGSIARTCAATKCVLNIVGQPAFDLSEKAVRRAGLDYWPWVKLYQFQSWEEYLEARHPKQLWLFTTHSQRAYYTAKFTEDATLVFGSETKGLGSQFLSRYPNEQKLKIPIYCQEVRSLNLSNSVSIALYEALRQLADPATTP